MEVSITMTFEALLSLQPLWRFTSNPFTLINGLDGCRGSFSLVIGRETLRCALRSMRGRSYEGLLTLKFFLDLDGYMANVIERQVGLKFHPVSYARRKSFDEPSDSKLIVFSQTNSHLKLFKFLNVFLDPEILLAKGGNLEMELLFELGR